MLSATPRKHKPHEPAGERVIGARRRDRHDDYDGPRVIDGREHVVCRCGWTSPPLPHDPAYDSPGAQEAYRAAWRDHVDPLTLPPAAQRLERRRDAGGWRDYLDARPVHCGTPIELALPDGTWWAGRYEMGWYAAEGGPVAEFYGCLGGPAWANGVSDDIAQVHFPIPAGAAVRWPARDTCQEW